MEFELGHWQAVLEHTAGLEGWAPKTPAVVLRGCFLYPEVSAIYKAFVRVSRGRNVTALGAALPILYRDIREECLRVTWDDKDFVEDMLVMCDDLILKHYAKPKE